MLEVEKNIDFKNDFEYKIKTNDGSLDIIFGGNGDLYWIFNQSVKDKINDECVLHFTKDDYFIYNLFDELYDSVKSCSPLKYYNYRLGNYDFTKDSLCIRAREKLFVDDKISWHSDDYHYNDAPVVDIRKNNDIFEVVFKKGKDEWVNSIRFRNDGSQYDPFNSSFMIMYNKLKNYYNDKNYHQIHFEEYIYEKEKTLKKK